MKPRTVVFDLFGDHLRYADSGAGLGAVRLQALVELLELFGVAGAGLVAAIPGGLFELTFGIWLITRGFRSTATAGRARSSRRVRA